ncbi:hypothetical protein BST23_04180 [Mycolicibacterium elephantis]|uniref:Uncharacterized protein n=1 Tax=Mycolicibacterium elephantis TaxID=81858 RepID=A0A1X0D781_9MYCO|nr:hypothetical protein [Mycolicibacterium elephantis]ORA68286.1 hypothetical protein BST23_04180 [Mycolicibacterium elephantis]
MADSELTIGKVTVDQTGGKRWDRGGFEYLFVFELSRRLTAAEAGSLKLKSSGLKISTHGPHKLCARLTEEELEANLDSYRALLQEVEAEGRESDKTSAESVQRRAEADQKAAADLKDTLNRVNKNLKG